MTAQYINKQKLASQKMTGSFSINFLKNVLKNDFDRSTPIMSIFHTNIQLQKHVIEFITHLLILQLYFRKFFLPTHQMQIKRIEL